MRKALFGTIGLLLGLSPAAAQSVWVGDFINSIGVNIHASQGYAPSNYITMLNYLGIRNVRDGGNHGNDTPYLQIGQGSGIRFDITTTNITYGLTTARGLASAGYLLSIEGPNEPNNFPFTYNGQTCGKGAPSWMPCAGVDKLTSERRATSQCPRFMLQQQSPHSKIDARRFETVDASDD